MTYVINNYIVTTCPTNLMDEHTYNRIVYSILTSSLFKSSPLEEDLRLNPEHKSCFKCVFCFNLRSFRVDFNLDESVMCPLTRFIKNFFHRFFKCFLMSTVHSNVKSQNTEFGLNILNTFGVTPINVFQNQNRS